MVEIEGHVKLLSPKLPSRMSTIVIFSFLSNFTQCKRLHRCLSKKSELFFKRYENDFKVMTIMVGATAFWGNPIEGPQGTNVVMPPEIKFRRLDRNLKLPLNSYSF